MSADEHGAGHDRSCVCWRRRHCGCYLWDQDCPSYAPPAGGEREALLAIMDAAAAKPKSCSEDGCQHYAGYLDSGDNELCACHWSDLVADECEGQPDPLPPYRERLVDAILASDVWQGSRQAPILDALSHIEPREYYEAKPHKAHRDLEAVRSVLEAAGAR